MKNVRMYGKAPFGVVVLHGGPGAAGEVAPVAHELGKTMGVLEPLQTKMSIAGQVEELKEVIDRCILNTPSLGRRITPPNPLLCARGGNNAQSVTLIGWSWGAWLAYLFAAQYPSLVKKLILVGSGPFKEKYAKDIMKTRLSRLNKKQQAEVEELQVVLQNQTGNHGIASSASGRTRNDKFDDDALLARFGKLLDTADSYAPLAGKQPIVKTSMDIYNSVWPEAAGLRRSGELLKLGKNIQCPVVAIHGDYDPHPAEGVQKPLEKVIKDFRFILLKNCGHKPWIEKYAKKEFYDTLKKELR